MYKLAYTQTAIEMLKSIKDQRRLQQIKACVQLLKYDPEKRGKPLTDDLRGLFSVRAAGQRYRVIYMVDTRPTSEGEGAEAVHYEGTVTIMAAGIRKDGDKNDIYRLFSRIFRRR